MGMVSLPERFVIQEKLPLSRDFNDSTIAETPIVSTIAPESNPSRNLLPETISYKNMVRREFYGKLGSNEEEEFDMQDLEENT